MEDNAVAAADNLDLSPHDLLTTTRSVRKRLDFARPVSRSAVEECLREAFQAPTGSNAQKWGWVVVDDPDTRLRMAELYRGGNDDALAEYAGGEFPDAYNPIVDSVNYLVENMHRVPILLVPTIDKAYGVAGTFHQASTWGSILPAVWSFMLALRSRGMGSAWTTLHLYREQEMADLLGIPAGNMQAGLFPIAYTKGTKFSPADRSGSDERIFWNKWTEHQAI